MLQVFIFIGRSGCGKGTQVELLKKYIGKSDQTPIIHIENGEAFRNFFSQTGYTNTLSKEIYELGNRQPNFLACFMWTQAVLDNYNGKEHLILDGTPRSRPEAEILESALKFYKFNRPMVVSLSVSRDWSRERLKERQREDDRDPREVEKRLDWFETDVLPAIEYFKSNPFFAFLEINGEQSVEAVHADIVSKISPILAK